MPDNNNPYQPPKTAPAFPTKKRAPWFSHTRLNLAIATTLPILVLVSFLWSNYQAQQTARLERYATYDHEYHFDPLAGLILLGLVFAIPNIVLYGLKLVMERTQR